MRAKPEREQAVLSGVGGCLPFPAVSCALPCAPGTRLVAGEAEHSWWSGTWGEHWGMATRAGHGMSVRWGVCTLQHWGMGPPSSPSCPPKAMPSLTLAMAWEGVMSEAVLRCGDSVGASVTHGSSCTLACLGPGSSVPHVSPSCPAAVPHATHVPVPFKSPCSPCPHPVLQPFPSWGGAGHTR